MSSPPCVVIVVRLATAATADSRAVGRGRERGDDDRGVKRGWEDEGTVIRRYGWRGWLLFFVGKVLIFAEAETETETSGPAGRGTGCAASHGPVSHLC